MAVELRNRFSKHDQIREKIEKCAAEPPLDRRATFLCQRGAAQLTSFLSVTVEVISPCASHFWQLLARKVGTHFLPKLQSELETFEIF